MKYGWVMTTKLMKTGQEPITLPFYGIFSTEKEAEECRQLVASRIIPVRVSSRKPRKSIVLDEDVKPLLPRQSASPSH
jgi:hypothetical protein